MAVGAAASPVAAQLVPVELVTVDDISPFATPDGRVGFDIDFRVDWPPPEDLFSIFFAVDVSGPASFPFSGGWQRHDGTPEAFGTTEQGESVPEVYLTSDHNVLIVTPIADQDLATMPGLFFGVQSAVMDTPDGTRIEGPGGGGSLPDAPGLLPVRDPLETAVFDLTNNTVLEPPAAEPDTATDTAAADDARDDELVEPNDDALALSDDAAQATLDEVNTQEFASDGSSPAAMIAVALVIIALLLLAVVLRRRKKVNLLGGVLGGSSGGEDNPLSGLLGGSGSGSERDLE